MTRLTKQVKVGNEIYYCSQDNEVSLKPLYDKLGKLEDIEEELGCPLENAMALFQVYRNSKFCFKMDDKILECKKSYTTNLYWEEEDKELFIDVIVLDKELNKEYGIYKGTLFANDYGKRWWLEKPEVVK